MVETQQIKFSWLLGGSVHCAVQCANMRATCPLEETKILYTRTLVLLYTRTLVHTLFSLVFSLLIKTSHVNISFQIFLLILFPIETNNGTVLRENYCIFQIKIL